jgi:hypothetical protein
MSSRPNGCGPSGVLGRLIPEDFLDVSFHGACNIHDERYSKGRSKKDRRIADQKFLDDMLLSVDRRGGIFLARNIRKLGAIFFYFGVRLFGFFYFGS